MFQPVEQPAKVVASGILTFGSGLAAQAGRGKVNGDVLFRVYSLDKKSAPRRIRTCYLQHGYGMAQGLLDFKRFSFSTFVKVYFGPETPRRLLETVCDEVIVAMQESVLTTMLEMTRRTEMFLQAVVCRPDPGSPAREETEGRKLCAYIGHSKGGAVAFNIARRCMQKTSLLGQDGCARLGEIYSMAGVIQGAMATHVAHGAYINKEQKIQALFEKTLGFGLNLVTDLYTAYLPGVTNPIWVDLSPASPMESDREDGPPVPLFVKNDIALEKVGWLVADFAASATEHHFQGKIEESLHGCGPKHRFELAYNSCRLFGDSLGRLHSSDFKTTFEKGLKMLKGDNRFSNPATGDTKYLQFVTWERAQNSDGLADFELALSACRKGLLVKEKRAVQKCTVLKGINHLANAGGNPEALADLIEQLGK